MAEKFFNKIADDVLKATENIQARFEEGWSVLSTGALPDSAKAGSSASSSPEIEFDLDDFDVEGLSEEELQELMAEHQQQMMENSPLKGIAENVMGNIMSQNVSKAWNGTNVGTTLCVYACDSLTSNLLSPPTDRTTNAHGTF
jgi:hypothetical protein